MARTYDPATGRYLEVEPLFLGGASNIASLTTASPYVYGYGDPINLFDPNGREARTPARGQPPNSSQEFRGEKGRKIRLFGPDGRATTDYDFGHDHGSGDPHAHDWDWGNPDPRGPHRPLYPGECIPEDAKEDLLNFCEQYPLVCAALAAGGGTYGTYRAIRMLPSLAIPPLWPTIPLNAIAP